MIENILTGIIIAWLFASIILGPLFALWALNQYKTDGYIIKYKIDVFLSALVFIITSPIIFVFPYSMGYIMDFVLNNVELENELGGNYNGRE